MQAEFWQSRWSANDIGFHLSETNPLLLQYFPRLQLNKADTVFIPLCGKTLDIHWLLTEGYHVIGAELSLIAVEQLFHELGLQAHIKYDNGITHFSAKNIDVFAGDIFQLNSHQLGPIDAIYDRAALVALPGPLRQQYTEHLLSIAPSAKQLIISFEYDQSLMDGPPFSVTETMIEHYYRQQYSITCLGSSNVIGGLKGICPAKESVYLLNN